MVWHPPLDVTKHTRLLELRAQGLTYAQIAAELGCPVGTVKSRLHRLAKLAKLAKLMRNEATTKKNDTEPGDNNVGS